MGYFDLNLIKHSDPDMVVFTKKNYRRALTHPKNFGWVLSENNVIKKTKIKDIPDDENYSMILGSFFFKNRKIYELLYKDIKNNNLKEQELVEEDLDITDIPLEKPEFSDIEKDFFEGEQSTETQEEESNDSFEEPLVEKKEQLSSELKNIEVISNPPLFGP